MSDAARAKVEADPARALAKMLSKMDDEDKEAFNLWHRMTKNWSAKESAEQTAALRAEITRLRESLGKMREYAGDEYLRTWPTDAVFTAACAEADALLATPEAAP